MDLEHLSKIAIKAALAAGEVTQKYMNDEVVVHKKQVGNTYASQVVTAVDCECERVILSYLKPTCTKFDIALLSEETEDDGSRFEKDFFWCVDPMDGTLAFINKHPGFSVAIALVAKDGTPQIGVVFDPSKDNLYYAIKDKGTFKNNKPWEINVLNNYLTYVTDKKLVNTPCKEEIHKIIEQKISEYNLQSYQEISGAGAVLNAILVAENRPAILLKLPKKENGGGSIWDFAATACIFKELGLVATNFDGEKLDLNKVDNTFMNHQGVFFESLS